MVIADLQLEGTLQESVLGYTSICDGTRCHPHQAHLKIRLNKKMVFDFYSTDGFVVEWQGPTVLKIKNLKKPKKSKPISELIISATN